MWERRRSTCFKDIQKSSTAAPMVLTDSRGVHATALHLDLILKKGCYVGYYVGETSLEKTVQEGRAAETVKAHTVELYASQGLVCALGMKECGQKKPLRRMEFYISMGNARRGRTKKLVQQE